MFIFIITSNPPKQLGKCSLSILNPFSYAKLVCCMCTKIPIGTAPPLVAVKITVTEAIETSQLELESRKIISEVLCNFWALWFKDVTIKTTQGLSLFILTITPANKI